MVKLYEKDIKQEDRQSSKGINLNGFLMEDGISLIIQDMKVW